VLCTAKRPGIGRDQKAIARHIENIVIDFERLPPDFGSASSQPAQVCEYLLCAA